MTNEQQTATEEPVHSEEINDIISATPSWLVHWGIVLFLGMFLLLGYISSIIKYPDVIRTQLVLNSSDIPKEIVSRVSGKLTDILVKENEWVEAGQPLAFLESTASHRQVLQMLKGLQEIQQQMLNDKVPESDFFDHANNTHLGELQSAYETFFDAYIAYKATLNDGYYLKMRAYLQNELKNLQQQKNQFGAQKQIQQRDSALAEAELAAHKELTEQLVESRSELRQEESKYLAKRQPLIMTESSILSSDASSTAKQKEIAELENQMYQSKEKFLEALNSLVSQVEDWKSKYVLCASQRGKVLFDGLIQQNQVLEVNQEVFHINSGSEHFFGLMNVPQTNM
jgi:multidrug efflux pump subunit AcrA (membrane-fusion protein)